ncbi:hypothetical protein NLU66_16475 [Brachybacterium sp. NBEC-018]|uniref:hypothetical protein n=1 Tax=Brachybacterium sp. NBEC-018 TaxID=2996004 RepID=UPI0021755513|nr:hypothetical protein [Brachybacterium sp. NBEC-018]UVY83783.1 hypothetical protein NLU66_16475 [Brachybacterium sp. NBEC-018]
MLSSPYPVPNLRIWRTAMILGWLCGAAAGVWVLVDPPKSYQGIGLTLTIMWGIMLALGSAATALAHAIRSYQIEIPGLILALGGIVVYDYLSWQATFGDSPGSGPRALLLALLAFLVVGRIRMLLYIDREARKLVDLREAVG